MPGARSRRRQEANYWPGFVDALSSLLLVIIFMLSLFMLTQFFLGQELEGRDTAEADAAELAALRLSKLGFVFQFHFLLPEFTILENVTIPMRRLGKLSGSEMKDRATEVLGAGRAWWIHANELGQAVVDPVSAGQSVPDQVQRLQHGR